MRAWILSLVGLLLVGCVGPVPKVDVPAGRLASVRTIAVFHPPEPKSYVVMMLSHPGMAFGLIGAAIVAGDQSSKQDRLSQAFQAQGTAITSRVARDVADRLTAAGYEAKVQHAPWTEADGKYSLVYEQIPPGTDAALVILPTMVGYIATSAAADYVPTVATVVTLLGKDRKEQIYRGYHAYGWTPKAEGWRSSQALRTFPNFDALVADPKASAAAVEEAGKALAETITADLKR